MDRTERCSVPPLQGTATETSATSADGLAAAWRAAAERGDPACVVVPRDGVLTLAWANRGLSQFLGRDTADITGRPLRELAGAEGTEGAPLVGWARLAHQLADSGGGTGLGQVRTAGGAAEHAHVTVTAVDVPAGSIGELTPPEAPCSWLVQVEPVSKALADAEAALTVAENRFTALAGCAPVGVFVSDAGLRLGYVNERFVSLTGAPVHALLGNAWLDIVHRDDLSAIYTAVQTVLAGTPVELAVRLAEDRGIPRWLQLRLAPTTTPARTAGFIGTAEDVTERRSWEEHLTYQAQHDPLTGLVNRRRLIEVLGDLLSSRRGRDREFAVLFLDLDGFQEIKDTLGNDVGDRALVEIARRLQRVARETDILGRVAGDEFVVVLRHVQSDTEAEAAARRHITALEEPIRIGTVQVPLSASVGVVLPSGSDTPESLLRAADRVRYAAGG